MDHCLSFNEILAHARAATAEVPEVETVFEIGGQDSKYIAFQNRVPIDYAMNEGCSAGTGSFLEEAVSVDLGIPVEMISKKAEGSLKPIFIGERCAAFINSDMRNALQQGAFLEDVIAGLVYSIARNYLSRIVGSRLIGDVILFQGGVALNKSVAMAIASLTSRKVVVPAYPELMGCVGCCLMASDLLRAGTIQQKPYNLDELLTGTMEITGAFRCAACSNRCEIKKIRVKEKEYPFGGLCSRYYNTSSDKERSTGLNLVADRNRLMFEDFGPIPIQHPLGTIGIPRALTSYEYYPFYAKLLNELGFNVILSEPSKSDHSKAMSTICYPTEIAHGAVENLLRLGVDYIFLPSVNEGKTPPGNLHSYLCGNVESMPDLARHAFAGSDMLLLTPSISFAKQSRELTNEQLIKMAAKLGVSKKEAIRAVQSAFLHYRKFQLAYERHREENWEQIVAGPTVILVSRPYIACSEEANLALPNKIVQRGYNVVLADLFPEMENKSVKYPHNVWYFGQQGMNAIQYALQYPNLYVCLVSCFSCVPDASLYHLYRHELASKLFCYLEVDSYTAHAGFDTRIGAFLDIIEQTEQSKANSACVKEVCAKNAT